MLSIFKRNKKVLFSELVPELLGGVDMHNHLLPGVDDGSPDSATSAKLIEGLNQCGFQKFICTSHVFKEIYPNTTASLQAAYHNLNTYLKSIDKVVPLKVAAENMLDDDFSKKLADNQEILCLANKVMLVECSFAMPPIDFDEKIFNIQLKGFTPVLAHPERYNYWHRMPQFYEELYQKGVAMQTNILSLGGYYGEVPKKFSEKMIERGLISYLGTDLHHERHLIGLQQLEISDNIVQLLTKADLQNKYLFN